MKAVMFEGANLIIGKGQPEYQELPAQAHGDPMQSVTFCMELTEEEIATVLLHGNRIWLTQATFGGPFQPILMSVEPPPQVVDHYENDSVHGKDANT